MPSHSTIATAWPWMVLAIILLAGTVLRRQKYARFPPGPSPLPIVGNIFDFPRKHLGNEFAALSRKFGDVVYLNLLGQDIVVLGSLNAARDLLDKRSANYSDRPTSVMAHLTEFDRLTGLINYGPRWRQHRRLMRLAMASDVVLRYEAIQIAATRGFLQALLHDPRNLASHMKFTISAIFAGTIYGIEIRGRDDTYSKMLERMTDVGEAILHPGTFPVEAFPALRCLPAWFPGGGFKTWAEDARRDIAFIAGYLFDSAKAVTGEVSKKSVINRILGVSKPQDDRDVELEKVYKEVAASLYVGGADTIFQLSVALGVFFMAMALYPRVQKKAQEELDAVVGTERLPELSDCHSLPYMNALVKELFRWHSGTPIGLPHRVVADDEYNGYLIPAGANVFVNIWAVLRDPDVYPQPDDFMPERFLDSAGNLNVDGRDPASIMFGFGRRVCPGRYFAESTLFIFCASVLSTFEIGLPVGEDGVPVEVKWEATDHLVVSHPKVHKYSIKPRSPHVERVIATAAPTH